jgi:hypothetical protein
MNNEPGNRSNPDGIPPEEIIENAPPRSLSEIIALVSDEIGVRIRELEDVFPEMSIAEREQALAILMAELNTADRIGILSGIEPDLLEELERLTDRLADD